MIRTALPTALVLLALAGCSDDTPESSPTGGGTATTQSAAVRFAACMREHGVTQFPDPDASGELTVDAVVNGSSIDPEGPAWKRAIAACRDLQPPGFAGDEEVTPDEQAKRLRFARCIRANGVPDFPDPGPGDPPVDTRRIPSADTEAGMNALNAAMQACGAQLRGSE